MAPVTINGKTLELNPAAHPPGTFASDAEHSNYILVQYSQVPTEAEFAALERAGAKVQRREKNNTLLCRYEHADLGVLQALEYVDHVAVYHPHFVIESSWQHVDELPGDMAKVDVILHDESDQSPQEVWGSIQSSIGSNVKLVNMGRSQLQIETKRDALDAIATIDSIRSLHPVLAQSHDSKEAFQLIGYSKKGWFSSPPFSSFSGEGEIVAVADTGFDNGTTNAVTTHSAFWGQWKNGVREVRVLSPKSMYLKQPPGTPHVVDDFWDDDGHGTAVAACVVGEQHIPVSFLKAISIETEEKRCYDIQGTAPAAKVFPIKWQKGAGTKDSLDKLFEMEYAPGQTAKVHNNSWGTLGVEQNNKRYLLAQGYTANLAGVADDAMNLDPELLIVFSNGNVGEESVREVGSLVNRDRQVMWEKSAKNPITVGWSLNHREFARIKQGSRTYNPPQGIDKAVSDAHCWDAERDIKSQQISRTGDPERVSYSSSRGPTLEGRIKPDVIAPGAGILSARSGKAPNTTEYGPSLRGEFVFKSGSSFAAPLVSGMAASLRSALKSLKQSPVTNPPGILIKALIINGAEDIVGNDYEWAENINPTVPGPAPDRIWHIEPMPTAPNGAQGWGLVNLERSLVCLTANGGYHIEKQMKRNWTSTFPITPPTKTGTEQVLTVTLCYNDAKGELIQDVLSLSVELTPKVATTPVPPSAAVTSPGHDLPSDTVKGGFTHSNVQRWTAKVKPSLFSNMKFSVANGASISATTDFAVVWAFTLF